jgi:16S rRNA (cytosine967-C5)-methyltransferase
MKRVTRRPSSRAATTARGNGQIPAGRSRQPAQAVKVKPALTPLAELTAAICPGVLRAVFSEQRRLVPALSSALVGRGKITNKDRAWMLRSIGALLRWWGWIEPLHSRQIEEQLLVAWLLDSAELSAMARVWAARVGRPPDGLYSVGDAPGWTARAEGLKRWVAGRAVNADPWRLFPEWLRDELPVPPGDASPKARRLDFLGSLQSHSPLWVAVRGKDEKAVWNELRDAGLKPWVHRRLATAAKLPADTDLSLTEAFQSGRLVAQDLASQAVGIVCDPDAGERWWDLRGENGLHALHLAALMAGKGLVVSTFDNDRRRSDTALRLRAFPFHNITTRVWDGKRAAGKAASFDGVLVDAFCSGIGSWRRHPDARWIISASQIPELAAAQLQSLDVASTRVRPGGTLVYTVLTVTRSETIGVVNTFLESHPDFKLDPFPSPLEDTTTGGTIQLWPQTYDSEARFIARMVRKPQ